MNMTVKKDAPIQIVPNDERAAILSIVARAASDPNVDIDKLERLMLMQERAIARQSAVEYSAALSDLQAELPSIGERGNANGRYMFALWEDINTQIKPFLQKHGFSLSFRTDTAKDITVTGVLSHRNGHSEQTSITLPSDGSGNKNAVQAVASSVSYGKRYTASALLNLTSHGEDDDAYSTVECITEAQAIQIDEYIEATESNKVVFLGIFKVMATKNLRASDFDRALKMLKDKEAKMKGAK